MYQAILKGIFPVLTPPAGIAISINMMTVIMRKWEKMTTEAVKRVAKKYGLPVYAPDGLIARSGLNSSTLSQRGSTRTLAAQTLIQCAVVIADYAKKPRIDILAEIVGIDKWKISPKNGARKGKK